MQPTPQEKLAASVFALGIVQGFVRREDVVRWADRRIAETDSPSAWLIDLSLSQHQHVLDLLGNLRRLAAGVDPVATCKAIYALLPDVNGYTFDQAEAFAARVYQLTFECLNGDWSQQLLSTTDDLADNFEFLRKGYSCVNATEGELIADVQQFIEDHRDEAIVRVLYPVRWSGEWGTSGL